MLLNKAVDRTILHLPGTLNFVNFTTRAQFHNHLIWLKFNPKYLIRNYTYFRQILSGMLKAKYIVYLLIYRSNSCICKKLHSESFIIWSGIIRTNIEGKYLGYEIGPRSRGRRAMGPFSNSVTPWVPFY